MGALTILAAVLAANAAASGAGVACAYTAGATGLALAGHPFATLPASDGCWLFVSMSAAKPGDHPALAVMRNVSGRFELARAITLQDDPAGLALTHDGALLVAATGDGVTVFDVASLESGQGKAALARIAEGSGVGAINVLVTPDDRLLFVSEERAARITVIDLARARASGYRGDAIIGRIPQGLAPVGLALSPDGTRLFATSERAPAALGLPQHCRQENAHGDSPAVPEGLLSIIDVARATTEPAKAILSMLPAGCSPVRVAVAPDGHTAWVTARGEDALLGFSLEPPAQPATQFSRRRLHTGPAPVGLAVAPDSGAVWVSNSNRFADSQPGSISRLDLASGDVRTLPSGNFPRDIAFLPDGRTLVIAVHGSQSIQFLPTQDATQ